MHLGKHLTRFMQAKAIRMAKPNIVAMILQNLLNTAASVLLLSWTPLITICLRVEDWSAMKQLPSMMKVRIMRTKTMQQQISLVYRAMIGPDLKPSTLSRKFNCSYQYFDYIVESSKLIYNNISRLGKIKISYHSQYQTRVFNRLLGSGIFYDQVKLILSSCNNFLCISSKRFSSYRFKKIYLAMFECILTGLSMLSSFTDLKNIGFLLE